MTSGTNRENKRQVVITGAGIICSIGNNLPETTASLIAGLSGIAPISILDTAHNDFIAGEVKLSNAELSNRLGLDPEKPHSRSALLGIAALREALAQAGLGQELPFGTGLVSGTTVGGMDLFEKHFHDFLDNNGKNEFIPYSDCASCTEDIADNCGNFDFTSTVSTACSSAANAIITAAGLISTGQRDCMAAGGCECLTRFHLNGFNSLKIVSKEPCRPFDANRNGLNLGEGAAYLILEAEETAKARGAKILARITGWGNTCDAYHQTASSPTGDGAYMAMYAALEKAGLQPAQIDYVNAHGTATENNDASETAALKRLFGQDIPHISSTKAFTGHTTSAAGAVEAVICLTAMRNGFVPANLNLSEPIPDGIQPCTSLLRTGIHNIMCNSFGFGGNDSCIIMSSYPASSNA